MSRRRPYIPQRRRIFLGCEGQSEGGYATLLARTARETPNIHVFINVKVLNPGAGNPLALVQKAIRLIDNDEEPYVLRAILLDAGPQVGIETRAAKLAETKGIRLIWQKPDHEALLLRHLPDCQMKQPPHGASFNALRAEWPQYTKGMTAHQLSSRISLDGIRQACAVETELRDFLSDIGLI